MRRRLGTARQRRPKFSYEFSRDFVKAGKFIVPANAEPVQCHIAACHAWIGRGLPCETVRDMMLEPVEVRFRNTDERPTIVEFLSDHGALYNTSRPTPWRMSRTTRCAHPCEQRAVELLRCLKFFLLVLLAGSGTVEWSGRFCC